MIRAILLLGLAALAAGCGDDGTGAGGGGAAGAGAGGGGAGGGPEACSTDVTPSETVVVTDRGAVEGFADGDVVAFRGVPFAAPPTGDNRFRPPEPHACWQGTRSATAFGPKCPQLGQGGEVEGEEDCLTLNVVTPAADDGARPVLFFIHGGGNIQGSASEPLAGGGTIYDGKHLAEELGVVVVTIQYRLGPLGYLALDELDGEDAEGVSGNYGTRDQIAALEWVRDNIADFGGDPGRVLLFGESAGAVNTCTLLTSPRAAGLFHAALMQSGSCRQPKLAAARTARAADVDASACGAAGDRVACLRGLPAEELLQELPATLSVFDVGLSGQIGYGPVVDGVILPQSSEAALAAGSFEPVPFVVGANAEELAKLITTTVSTEAEYVAAVEAAMAPFGEEVTAQALALYPTAEYASPQDALVAFLSDQRFVCPSRRIARVASGHGTPVYRYFFRRRAQTPNGFVPAQHGIELLYVFGTMADIPQFSPAQADVDLGRAIRSYWAGLAAEGAPSAPDAPAWAVYDASTDQTLVLDAPITIEANIRAAQCDFWDGLTPPAT